MKNGIAAFASLLLMTTLTSAQQHSQFSDLRDSLRARYTRHLPDGSIKVSKQFRRWEWFWESRTLTDGSLPTAGFYLKALRDVQQRKQSEDVQAKPAWREIGPYAPDLPGQSAVWNGIGRVNCMAFHPTTANTMWIGAAQGGLWKTTDAGSSWREVPITGFPQTGLSDIAVAASNPQVMYLATGDIDATFPGELSGFPGFTFGVLKSTNGGASWTQTGMVNLPEQNQLIGRLWVDPRNENVVLAATYNGMHRSVDGGATWTTAKTGTAFRDLVANPAKPDLLYASTFNRNGSASCYRSEDNGVTWTLVKTFPAANRLRLAVTPADSKVLGIIASDAASNALEGVYYSNDQGLTFAERSVPQNLLGWSSTGNDWAYGGQGFYDLALAIDPTNANIWAMGGVNNWRSTDAGKSWVLSSHWVGQGAPWVHADHHFMAFGSNGRLYTCTDGGIARSTDRGVSWRDISNGLSIQQYYGIAVSEQNSSVVLCGAQDNGTARSSNGTDFQHVLDGDGMATAIDYYNSSLMYASQPNGVFYRSNNGGSNWRMISTAGARGESSGAWVSPIAADPTNPNTLYVGYTRMYRSTDMGNSWTQLTPFGSGDLLRKIAIAPSDNNYIYAAFTSNLYKSSDGGSTWLPQSGVSGYIQDIKVDPSNPKRVFLAIGGFNPSAKILEVNDNQVTNLTGAGLPNVPANAVVYQPGVLNRLYLGTDLGVFFKDEKSNVWEPYGTGLPATVVSGMELLNITDKLRISTYGRGVWEVAADQCVAKTPIIKASGPTAFCAGDSVRLTAPDGYAVYRWSNGSGERSIVLSTYQQSGTYSLTVEDANGCRATSAETVVAIKRAPGKPFLSLRGSDTVRATALGGISIYQWFLNGDPIPGATSREHVATKSGWYRVRATNDDGCSTMSDSIQVVLSSVSEVEASKQLIMWPNPASDVLHIVLPPGENVALEIIGVKGATAYRTTVQTGGDEWSLDLSAEAHLADGTYVVRAVSGAGTYSQVFVKR